MADPDYEIRVFDPDTGGAVPLTKGGLEKIMPDVAEIDDHLMAAIVEAFEGVVDGTLQAVPCTEATDDDELVHHGEGCRCAE